MKRINWSTLFVTGVEWFARLAVLNLCWLFFSLPLITFIPATFAGYRVLKLWYDNEALEESVFKLFKDQFTQNFKNSYRLGIPFLLVGSILVVNLIFFFSTTNESSWFFILKFANVLLAILFVFLYSYTFAISTFVEESAMSLIKISFLVMFIQPRSMIVLFILMVLAIMVFDIFPALLFFFSISVIAYQFLKAAVGGYEKVIVKSG